MSQCRFYEKKFPEIDDVVVVNVRSIADMGAYVHLLEYNNIEGMILLRSVYFGPISTLLSTNLLTYKVHSTEKRASRTPAVRRWSQAYQGSWIDPTHESHTVGTT